MIRDFIISQLQQRRYLEDIIFMQNGAPPDIDRRVNNCKGSISQMQGIAVVIFQRHGLLVRQIFPLRLLDLMGFSKGHY